MLASEWLAEAWRRRLQPNPNAMTLATATLEGWPAARIVLCKDVVGVPGYVVFYTNFQSRKGLELAANPRAAAVMHWDHMHRQVRIEGLVETAPAADSDAYFASRARGEPDRGLGQCPEQAGRLARGAAGAGPADDRTVRRRRDTPAEFLGRLPALGRRRGTVGGGRCPHP